MNDELQIRTSFGKMILNKWIAGIFKKKLSRTVGVDVQTVSMIHNTGERATVHLDMKLHMTEAELGALIQQIVGG